MPKNLSSSYPRRCDFERGANLLKENIDNNRIRFAPQLVHIADSILRVRVLPNGRLNLETVDELVRTHFHFLTSKQVEKYYETER